VRCGHKRGRFALLASTLDGVSWAGVWFWSIDRSTRPDSLLPRVAEFGLVFYFLVMFVFGVSHADNRLKNISCQHKRTEETSDIARVNERVR
jgi:hypothetical protein